MEFLSDKDGEEYSVKRTHPPGKWFFYEQILQVPIYVIFNQDGGLLEFYQLENGHYELKQPDENGRHWIDSLGLYVETELIRSLCPLCLCGNNLYHYLYHHSYVRKFVSIC